MTQLVLYARTLLGYFLCIFVVLFCFVPAVILAMILPANKRYTNKLLFWLLDATYKGAIKCMMIPITVSGREHMPTEPAIFVANHESVLDIPVLGALMNGQPHIWFVLDRFARTPLLGSIVRRMFIPVDQGCSMKSSRSLIQAIRTVEQYKLHTLLFPEGGRYTDGKIHDFFQGFAILAKKTRQPVIPVMLYNLGKIYPRGSFLAHYYPVNVVIGKPFVFQETETPQEFSERVQQWFKEQITK